MAIAYLGAPLTNPADRPDAQRTDALHRLVATGLRSARRRHHRLALLLAGSAPWCRLAAEACLTASPGQGVWLSDGPGPANRQPLAAGQRVLGQELAYLVYDAHAGFDPDSFGAATGALRGGGLLLLLTPPLPRWPALPDPQARRVAVLPYGPDQLGHRFLSRLTRVLAGAAGLIRVEEGVPIPPPLPTPWWSVPELAADPDLAPDSTQQPTQEPAPGTARESPPGRDSDPGCDTGSDPGRPPRHPDLLCRTRDQRLAVAAILRAARGRPRRPLIIVADRGRGKTAALGLAAGELLASGMRRILVTAPRLSAVEPLFRHAAPRRPDAHATGELRFLAPDALCQHPEPAELLLVDEAAAIPAPLLEILLQTYPRLVFATTIHGYEGTGRGFEVRFRHTLERLTPDFRRIELQTPIRWAPDDPLEALVGRALLLDATPAGDQEVVAARPDSVEPLLFDRDTLARDEASLSQLFGLLVLAHYQTRPLDLRHLLDGPNLQVQALRHRGQIVATALVAREGGLPADLAADIYQGRRRPQGHLLPQTLSAHAGLAEAPDLRWARIVRLAVHPAIQGRGLGRRLLQEIEAQARAEGLDLLGSSFGATADLLRFWSACGLHPVHLGTSRNAASGVHAAVVLRPLSPPGEDLARRATVRYRRRFPFLLAGPFRHLEPGLVADLLAFSSPASAAPWIQPLAGQRPTDDGDDGANRAAREARRQRSTDGGEADSDPDWQELAAFAFAQRPFEASLAALQALARDRLGPALRAGYCHREQAIPLIVTVLQCRDWAEACRVAGVPGRAQLIAVLRASCARLM